MNGTYTLVFAQPFIHTTGSYDPHNPDEKSVRAHKKEQHIEADSDAAAVMKAKELLKEGAINFEGKTYRRKTLEFYHVRDLDLDLLK